MVLLLKSQGMKNCKSAESFCFSIQCNYSHKWLVHLNFAMFTAFIFFFYEIPKFVQA